MRSTLFVVGVFLSAPLKRGFFCGISPKPMEIKRLVRVENRALDPAFPCFSPLFWPRSKRGGEMLNSE